MPAIAAFGYAPKGQITFAFQAPQLMIGVGASRLTFPVKAVAGWLARESQQVVPLMVSGTAWLVLPTQAMRWLGSIAPQTIHVRGYDTGEALSVGLADEQIIAVEDLRGFAGDLQVRLDIQATWLNPPQDVYATQSYQVPITILKASWLSQLDQAGYEVGFLIRVPSPLTHTGIEEQWAQSATDHASRAQGAARLRQARRAFDDGDFELCVATSRKVLENLKRLMTIPTLKSILDIDSDKRSPDERWAFYFYAAWNLTHPAHHDDETTRAFVWSRQDAQAILGSVAALLARVR